VRLANASKFPPIPMAKNTLNCLDCTVGVERVHKGLECVLALAVEVPACEDRQAHVLSLQRARLAVQVALKALQRDNEGGVLSARARGGCSRKPVTENYGETTLGAKRERFLVAGTDSAHMGEIGQLGPGGYDFREQ